MAKKKQAKYRYRCAKTGRYIKAAQAKRRPKTTVREKVV